MDKRFFIRAGYISQDTWQAMDKAYSLARAEEAGLEKQVFLERLILAGIKALSLKEKK